VEISPNLFPGISILAAYIIFGARTLDGAECQRNYRPSGAGVARPQLLYVTFGHGSRASLLTPENRGRDTSNSHVF
jgi:hypothetical protein